MILVKIEGVVGDVKKVIGDVTLDRYDSWFTATGFSFQIGESSDKDDPEENDDPLALGGSREQNKSGKKSPKKKGNSSKNNKLSKPADGAYLELTIDKESDAASVYLMQLAMMSRSGKVDKYVKVDIHVMEQGVHTPGSPSNLHPYIEIRLENAIVGGWSLNGDEKGLATEELTLWYDRAAMKFITYMSKDSKQVRQVHGPLGWDVENGEPWQCPDLAKDK